MLLLTTIALAVPLELTHQGRLMDSSGLPLTGTDNVTFRIFDVQTGGTELWAELHTTSFDEGYYSARLGSNNPLDDAIFDSTNLWVEVEVGGTILPRQPLKSVPYALRADTATNIVGGVVDVSEIRINGNVVLDDSGIGEQTLGGMTCTANQIAIFDGTDWGCSAPGGNVDWADIVNAPADFSDDIDNDTLASLSCGFGQVAVFSGAWSCADRDWNSLLDIPAGFADGTDDELTEAEVEGYVTNGAIDLASGSTLGAAAIATMPDLPGESDVETWITNGAIDLAGGSTMGAAALATVPDLPTESEVETWITNGAIDLAAGTTVGLADIATITDLPTEADVETWVTNAAIDFAAGSSVDGDLIATQGDLNFALNNQSCSAGDVVTEVDSSGLVVCGKQSGVINLTDSATCDAGAEGSLQFDTSNDALQICDGTDWVTVTSVGELYSFGAHTFTTCGRSGRNGPTLVNCRTAYGTPWDENGAFFDMSIQGIQRWTVPATGTYRIHAEGAAGGHATDYSSHPGRGASMQGDFDLVQGDVLQIVVGQRGQTTTHTGGGGGGSFVVKSDNSILLIAGGGGGALHSNNHQAARTDGWTSPNGRNSAYLGGTSGGGGQANTGGNTSAGGGGFSGNGQNGVSGAQGGRAFLDSGGPVGGVCASNCGTQAGEGGFGGGGGTYHHDTTAGAGGYSGGGAGGTSGDRSGGGGGSINNGANQVNQTGANPNDGTVTITRL